MLFVSLWNRFSVLRMEDLFFKVENRSIKTLLNSLRILYHFMKKMRKMEKRNPSILMALISLKSHNLQEKLKIIKN